MSSGLDGEYMARVPLLPRAKAISKSIVLLFPAQSYNPFQCSTLGRQNQTTGPEMKLVCHPRWNSVVFDSLRPHGL